LRNNRFHLSSDSIDGTTKGSLSPQSGPPVSTVLLG
jgi:hypothetical protein